MCAWCNVELPIDEKTPIGVYLDDEKYSHQCGPDHLYKIVGLRSINWIIEKREIIKDRK